MASFKGYTTPSTEIQSDDDCTSPIQKKPKDSFTKYRDQVPSASEDPVISLDKIIQFLGRKPRDKRESRKIYGKLWKLRNRDQVRQSSQDYLEIRKQINRVHNELRSEQDERNRVHRSSSQKFKTSQTIHANPVTASCSRLA